MSREEGERTKLVDKIKYFENSNFGRYFKVIWNISSVGNPDNLIMSCRYRAIAEMRLCESKTVPSQIS